MNRLQISALGMCGREIADLCGESEKRKIADLARLEKIAACVKLRCAGANVMPRVPK